MLVFASLVMIALSGCLSGCATPWQNKVTSGYLTATSLVSTAESTAKTSCDQNAISVDKCVQLQTIYRQIRQGCVACDNTLSLALVTVDAVQQQALLAKYNTIMADINTAVASYIQLYSQLDAGKMKLNKYAISPEVLTIIINAFAAVVSNIPAIISAIGSWSLSTVDVNALLAQIHAATAALPVW